MAEVESYDDPTDRGVSRMLTPDELDAIRQARQLGQVAADVPSGPAATAASRARIIERETAGAKWARGRGHRLPRRPCNREQCMADWHMWCRRTVRANREPGFLHDGR